MRAAGVHGVESDGGLTFIGEMGLGCDGLWSDAESGFEDSFVKEDDVEFALKRRNVGQKLREIDAVAKRQDVESWLS